MMEFIVFMFEVQSREMQVLEESSDLFIEKCIVWCLKHCDY